MRTVQRRWAKGLFGYYVKSINLVETAKPIAKELTYDVFEWQCKFLPMTREVREKVVEDMRKDLGIEYMRGPKK